MIEVIYNEEGKEVSGADPFLKLPKNIRQIGEIDSKKKIYIEDYVVTWLHQLCSGEDVIPKAAVLLGGVRQSEGIRYLFISGALELNDLIISGNGISFTDEEWTSIYERMKKYFDSREIVGWFLGVNGFSLNISGDILKAHIDNFAGNDKLFMMYENAEKEDGFFLFENGDLVRQPGFYIYFEKNPEMQEYMIICNQGKSVEEEENISDHAAREFRTVVRDKQELRDQKKVMSFMYAASTFLVMIVLVMGITMVNNYDKMQNMEASLQVISNSVTNQNNENEQKDSTKKNNTSDGQVPVDSVDAGIQKDDKKSADKKPSNSKQDTKQDTGQNTPAGSQSASKSYIVKDGDTLVSISKKFYGNDKMVKRICEKNNLDNGDKIFTGQKLILP